jgi:hypothetical protein
MCIVLNCYQIQLFESTNKKNRHCTDKVTLRPHETIVEVENQLLLHILDVCL